MKKNIRTNSTIQQLKHHIPHGKAEISRSENWNIQSLTNQDKKGSTMSDASIMLSMHKSQFIL